MTISDFLLRNAGSIRSSFVTSDQFEIEFQPECSLPQALGLMADLVGRLHPRRIRSIALDNTHPYRVRFEIE